MDGGGDGRRRPVRAVTATVLAVLVLSGVLAWWVAASPADTVTGPAPEAAPEAAPAPCRQPVGTSVPDCPVRPASVGETGVPALPEGWQLYTEDDVPLPTATAERIQVRSRRYSGPEGGMLLVEVLHGDVGSLQGRAAEYEAVERSDVRPDATVLVANSVGGRRYLWEVDDRVLVDVTFRDTGLSPADEVAIVQGVRTEP